MNLHEAAATLLCYALRSGLLLAVGLIAPGLLGFRHPKALLIYWRVLLVAVLLLPLTPIHWPGGVPPLPVAPGTLAMGAVVEAALPTTVPGLSWQLVVGVVGAVAGLGVLRLALGLAYLDRCRRRARPLLPFPPALADLRSGLGLETPFMVSERVAVPLTYGWLRPTVLLPESFNELTVEQQEGVACHELLHIKRGDWPATLFEELLRAVVWFHPAVWLILPRLALAREQIVDTDTVRLTGKRRQYLDALWSVVCASPSAAVALAVPLLGRRDLVARIVWLTKERSMSKPRLAVSVAVLAVCLVVAGAVGGAVFTDQSLGTFAEPEMSPGGSPQDADTHNEGDSPLETVSFEGECNDITHPVAIEKVDPAYPPDARQEKLMGTVVMKTVITEDGEVDDIEVLDSDDERFSAAAVSAIKKWRFEPALCDGAPVAVYYVLTVNFRLE